MKPRDLLLKRHEAIERKLDGIRHSTLAELNSPTRNRRQETTISWRRVLSPFRWHLVGLSAAWCLIAVLHLGTSVPPAATASGPHENSASSDTLMAVRDNREQLLRLLELPEPAKPVNIPRRRGSLGTTNTAV